MFLTRNRSEDFSIAIAITSTARSHPLVSSDDPV